MIWDSGGTQNIIVHECIFFSAVYQVISIFLSLSSLSSSIVAYIQASRWADVTKPQMTPMGYFVSFLWRFFIVFSRVFMLSLFATIFQMELFIFLGLHWLFMTTWIFLMVHLLIFSLICIIFQYFKL